MESAIVGGLAALMGLLLGRVWDRRSESDSWRRDQRMRCYEQLFGTYYRLRDDLRLLAAAKQSTAAYDKAIDCVLEVGACWQRDIAAVWLHGSEPVASAAKVLDDRTNELFMIARSRELDWDEFRLQRVPAEAALEGLIEAIRHEARLPEFHVVLRWDPDSRPGGDASIAQASGTSGPSHIDTPRLL